ncbi:MAG: hypothetical protein JSS75_02725 [Bacteroidetes bacterium]|nr:hypothetical protein [Bacteroidota bacterium]
MKASSAYCLLVSCFLLVGGVDSVAQPIFHAAASGNWSDSRNWEQDNGGIWLRPPDGVYPGSPQSRNVDVVIDRDVRMTVDSGPEIHIRSLMVSSGLIDIKGKMIIGPTSNDPNNHILISPSGGTIGLSDDVTAAPEPVETTPVIENPLALEQNVPNPVSYVTGDWTTIRYYVDRDYPLVRLALFDQMGFEIKRIVDESSPAVGWHSVRINVRDLQSGSYPIVLQAGNRVLRRSLTRIR